METLIPILSLLVAALAVFFGPVVAARTARSSMLGEMREKWIGEMRDLLAEFSGRCRHYYHAGFDDRTEAEYQHITTLEHKILFMVMPDNPTHRALVTSIKGMLHALRNGEAGEEEFFQSYEDLFEKGRAVLNHEWDVVKNP